jgi:hypothetical protein
MKRLVISILVFAFANSAFAYGEGSRAQHKFGFYGTVLNDPYPSLWGVNLGYNLTEFMRFTVGYGTLAVGTASVTSYNAGMKFFIPGWSFSPFAGANYNVISSTGSLAFNGINMTYTPGTNLNTITASAGLEWQSEGGFILGAMLVMPFGNSVWNNTPLSGMYVGFFFI